MLSKILLASQIDYENNFYWYFFFSAMRMAAASHIYFLSKFLEFLDTFFFIARKKFTHVSRLQLIHHGIMPLFTFLSVRWIPNGNFSFNLCILRRLFNHQPWLRRIWSQTTYGPPLPVYLDKPFPLMWSPWKKGPHKIRSPWTNGPQKFGLPGQMVPNQFGPRILTACPSGQTEYSRNHLYKGTKLVGDHLNMGTKFLGTICPGGPINRGPNVWEPYAFGTICVTA